MIRRIGAVLPIVVAVVGLTAIAANAKVPAPCCRPVRTTCTTLDNGRTTTTAGGPTTTAGATTTTTSQEATTTTVDDGRDVSIVPGQSEANLVQGGTAQGSVIPTAVSAEPTFTG